MSSVLEVAYDPVVDSCLEWERPLLFTDYSSNETVKNLLIAKANLAMVLVSFICFILKIMRVDHYQLNVIDMYSDMQPSTAVNQLHSPLVIYLYYRYATTLRKHASYGFVVIT